MTVIATGVINPVTILCQTSTLLLSPLIQIFLTFQGMFKGSETLFIYKTNKYKLLENQNVYASNLPVHITFTKYYTTTYFKTLFVLEIS